ncbi:MAG: hypothetical protein PHF00_00650 [Elusimicrobia bacterium]|nr:hypothetical protein [Elusimicrobiota bacterium]
MSEEPWTRGSRRARCRIWRRLGLSLWLGAAAPCARAAFDVPLLGPGPAATAGAFSAGSGEASAIFWNPAGTFREAGGDCYFAYSQLYAGLSGASAMGLGLLSGAAATRLGTLALGVGAFQAQGLLSERVVALGLSRRLSAVATAGASVKLLDHGYSPDAAAADDPVFARGTGRRAASWDAGLTLRLGRPWTWSLALRNINRPDVGLSGEDRVPREAQSGLAYEFAGRDLRVSAALSYREAAASPQDAWEPAVGLEKGVADGRVRFRAGLTPSSLGAGFGLRLGRAGLDYALVLRRDLLSNNAGTHMLGLSLRFGGANPR